MKHRTGGPYIAMHGESLFPAAARLVTKVLEVALRRRRVRSAALEVYIVSDAVMRAVNRRTRGIDAPTTVLSFPAFSLPIPYPPASGAPYRGEIYLAPRCIRSRGEDLALLAVHALLHLLGYTHARERDTIEMEQEEQRLLHGTNTHQSRYRLSIAQRNRRH